jgi:hypothetical protein
MAECGLPREDGTSTSQTSTNIFGGDGLYRRHRSDLLPRVGGSWNPGARAGSFAVALNNDSGYTSQNVGLRSARFLSA